MREDPLARLELSNTSHWAVVKGLMGMTPRLLVLGGGGYNPWSVGRLWTGVWATLNGYEIPDRLPERARSVLAGLSWTRTPRLPEEYLIATLRDAPRPHEITETMRDRVRVLRERGKVWV